MSCLRQFSFAFLFALLASAAWADTTVSASSYIQDGLVVQYDGIENAGVGRYDANATAWKDLKGQGGDMPVTGIAGTTWDGRGFSFSGGVKYDSTDTTKFLSTPNTLNLGGAFTIQMFCNSGANYACRRWDAVPYTSDYESWASASDGFLERLSASVNERTRLVVGPWIADTDIVFSTIAGNQKHRFVVDPIDGVVQSNEATLSSCAFNSRLAFMKAMSDNQPRANCYSIRVYNRALTDDELTVNANIDRMRFKNADPATQTWPEGCGYRWNATDQNLECRLTVGTGEGGAVSVSVDGEEIGAEGWFKIGSTVTLHATPSEGFVFVCWEGDGGVLSDVDRSFPTLTHPLTAPFSVRPVFAKAFSARSYIQDELVVQFDGVENTGFGMHDATVATWVDLTGNKRNGAITGSHAWQDNGLQINSVSDRGLVTFDATHEKSFTFDICLKVDKTYGQYARIIADMSTPAMCCYGKGASLTSAHAYVYASSGYDKDIGTEVYDATKTHTSTLVLSGNAVDGVDWYHDGALLSHNNSFTSTGSTSATLGNRSGFDRGLDGVYHSVRIYNRALSPEEIAFNANIDKIRFENVNPATLTWPDGYRWNSTTQNLEYRVSIDMGEGGAVSVNGVDVGAKYENWFAVGARPVLAICANPDAGLTFWRWDGSVDSLTHEERVSSALTRTATKPLSLTAVFGVSLAYDVSFAGFLTNNLAASTMVIKSANLLEVTPVSATAAGTSMVAGIYDWIGHRVDHLTADPAYSTFEFQYNEGKGSSIKTVSMKLTQVGEDVVVTYGSTCQYLSLKGNVPHPVTGEIIATGAEMARAMLGVVNYHEGGYGSLTPSPYEDYASQVMSSSFSGYGIRDPVFRVTPSVSRPTATRATLAVTGYTTSELDDFPIPVRISETRIPGFSYAHSLMQGQDIRAFSVDGTTEYPCDIDHWDPKGESIVWVKLPKLKPNASFTLVWGGDASPLRTNVWQGYVGVWHMDEESGNVADAAGNGLTAQPHRDSVRTCPVAEEGPVGNARRISEEYKQSGPRLRVANGPNLKHGSRFTVSCWAKEAAVQQWPRLLSRKTGHKAAGWEIQDDTDATNGTFRQYANSAAMATAKVDNKLEWHRYVFVYDHTTLSAYVDGVLSETATIDEADVATDQDLDLVIGAGAGTEWSLNGWMDEVRLRKGSVTADRVKADYLVQTNTALVSSLFTGSVEQSTKGTASVTVGHLVPEQTCRLVAQLVTADGTPVGEAKVLSDSAAAGETFSAEWTGLKVGPGYVVTIKATVSGQPETVVGETTFPVRWKKLYALVKDDSHSPARTSFGQADSASYATVDNWKNVDDEDDLVSVPASGDDYLVDGKRLRTSGALSETARFFAGDRLTLKNNAELHFKQYGDNPVTIDDLVVEDSILMQGCGSDYLSRLRANLTIPDGKTCKMTLNEGGTDNRSFRLLGTLVGTGHLLLSPISNGNTAFSVGLDTDMSAFDGTIEFAHQPRSAFFSSWCEPRELPTLVTNSVALHNGTTSNPNAYYFDDSFALVSTNRGITIAGTHNVTVKKGCTVSLKNPLYGSGSLVKTEVGRFFTSVYDGTNSTLRLEADRGDWTGTLTIEGGTVELAGAKPLGDGTLDATAEGAQAVVDGDALGAEGCFIANIAKGSKITLKWANRSDFTEDVTALRVPLATGLEKGDIELDLPAETTPSHDALAIRRSVRNGEVVFSVGPRRGIVIVVR